MTKALRNKGEWHKRDTTEEKGGKWGKREKEKGVEKKKKSAGRAK